MDPFDAVTPIGQRQPKSPTAEFDSPPQDLHTATINRKPRQFATLGQGEREARARVHRAHRVGVDPTASTGPDGFGKQLKKSPRLRSVLSVPEALAMTSHLARIFYADASAPGTRGSERKHLSVGYGVMIDKLNALSGRPTEIIGYRDVDAQRPGALELAQRLAASACEQSA